MFAKLDKLEGLPKLAPGYFWRIRPTMDGPSGEYSWLELRKRVLWVFSRRVNQELFLANPRSHMGYSWNGGKTKAEVIAEDLCKVAAEIVRALNTAKETRSLYGDYIS